MKSVDDLEKELEFEIEKNENSDPLQVILKLLLQIFSPIHIFTSLIAFGVDSVVAALLAFANIAAAIICKRKSWTKKPDCFISSGLLFLYYIASPSSSSFARRLDNWSISSKAIPAPLTTEVKGSSIILHGIFVSLEIKTSNPFNKLPPPAR